jgi:PhnB protein
MVKKVSPIPKGYRTATPCLVVSNIEQAVDFYAQAFGATLLTQSNDPGDIFAIQATIKIGNSIIILQQESIESGLLSPLTLGNSSSQLHLYVEDVDILWAKALTVGAVSISDPVDAYWGDRTGILIDTFGHRWSLASRVEHVSKDDIKKRYAALFEVEAPVERYEPAELFDTDFAPLPEEWSGVSETEVVRH